MKKKPEKKIIKKPHNWHNKIVTKPLGRGFGSGLGHKRKIETPEKLWEMFIAYTEWSKANPYKVHKGFSRGKKIYEDREKVTTFIGFEGWLCLNEIVYDLTHYESAPDYRPTILKIKRACSLDTLTGASAGVYNANIASKLEGLTDKSEVEVKDNRKEVGDVFPFEDKPKKK